MFKDKVVIITGASSGIGKALAVEFSKNGSHLVLAARSLDKLQEVSTECIKYGVQTLIVQTDVSIESDCENMIQKTIEKFGKIDFLVNNAGVSMRALFKDVNINVLKKLMDVNFWGTVYCTKFAYPYLLQSKGTLIGIVSVAAFKGLPARTGYSASKFAMFGFLETIRIENVKTGLKVITVAPGFTESNIRNTALTKDGSTQKESPRNEKNMMKAEVVAKKTIKAIKNGKNLLILTYEGRRVYWLRQFVPTKISDLMVYNSFAKEPDSPLI